MTMTPKLGRSGSAVAVLAFAAVLSGAACSTPANADLQPAQAAFAARATAQQATDVDVRTRDDGGFTVNGRLDGDHFAMAVPSNWNGEALVFAHGYSVPGSAIAVSKDPVEKDPSGGLMTVAYAQGFAVAHSDFDKAGVGVESAVENTLRLRAFLGRMGVTEAYVAGGSMGGNIVMAIIETHPTAFKGAMSGCGLVDNWSDEVGLLIDLRALYNFYTRDTEYALPGETDIRRSALSTTTPDAIGLLGDPYRLLQMKRIADPIAALFKAARDNPGGREDQIIAKIASITGVTPEPASLIVPIMTVSLGMDDMNATFGGFIYDNSAKVYASPLLSSEESQRLNHEIARITADPAAVAYADRWRRSTGRFSTPLVVLHNRVDSLVPYSQFEGLVRKTQAAGNADRLLAITVPEIKTPLPGTGLEGIAHCGFTPAQLGAAFDALQTWTTTGQRPTPVMPPPAPAP
ncbi:alpha/beta hydrolase [Brevundimonas intermedia]|uniref:Alpha/beta hydrolase n=1 Tax=Brevundimonas intermedia TaxID=74315 RepID=A0A4Y9RYK0_9CAUL|nr:alpha/beta hydrolase [Brevundimonas intermedia]TFW13973.1 alpha/beta hydrolase [Brevundimonas intermedia]